MERVGVVSGTCEDVIITITASDADTTCLLLPLHLISPPSLFVHQLSLRGSADAAEGMTLDDLKLVVGQAQLSARGLLGGRQQDAVFSLTDFPAVLLQPLLSAVPALQVCIVCLFVWCRSYEASLVHTRMQMLLRKQGRCFEQRCLAPESLASSRHGWLTNTLAAPPPPLSLCMYTSMSVPAACCSCARCARWCLWRPLLRP